MAKHEGENTDYNNWGRPDLTESQHRIPWFRVDNAWDFADVLGVN